VTFGNMTKLEAFLLPWLRGALNVFRVCIDFISDVFHPLLRFLTRNQVRILCYHRICDLPQTKDAMDSLNVCPAVFAQQMAFLSQNRFNVITLDQFISHSYKNRKLPPKAIIITFDDGYRDNYINAFTILKKYNLEATFFVVTDCINSTEVFPWLKPGEQSLALSQENKQYWLPLSKQDILDMGAHGASFGSHTRSHCGLGDVDESRAMEELRGSKEQLEQILMRQVKCFSYPYGNFSESVLNLVKAAGYEAAVTIKRGGNTLKSDPFELRRIIITAQDSPTRFKRKVEGIGDWFEYLLPAIGFIQRIVFRRGVE